MSVRVSYKKQAVVGIMLLLTILLVTEITARIYDYYYPNCRFLKSEVYTNVDFDLKRRICVENDKLLWNNSPLYLIPNQHYSTININSQGFRGEEITKEKPNDTYRIFVIGGSTTFGVGSTSDDTTMPGFLQKKISELTFEKHVEVINAGIPAAYSFTETNYIKNKILDYSPDLLIIYDGWNDIGLDFRDYGADSNELGQKIIREIKRSEYITANVILKWYFNNKYDTTKKIQFDDSFIDKKVEKWKNSWEEICKIGDENNINVIITLQPIVGSGNKPLSSEERDYYEHYGHLDLLIHYEKYANALIELNSTCTTADLRYVFDNYSQTIYYDSGHVNDFGNEIIAQKIFELIMPTISYNVSG
jgi:hypothetical protein